MSLRWNDCENACLKSCLMKFMKCIYVYSKLKDEMQVRNSPKGITQSTM